MPSEHQNMQQVLATGDFAFNLTCMSSECCDQGAVFLLQFEDGYLAWMVTDKHMPGFNIKSIMKH